MKNIGFKRNGIISEHPGFPGAESRESFDKMSLHFVLPLVIFYFVIGLLLLMLNEWVTNVAAWALAAGLIIFGGWFLLKYFRSDLKKRLAGADMAIGLVLFLAGILLITSPWIMLIFAGVSLVIGVLALLNRAVFGDNQHTFIGIFMIGEAILDLVTFFLISRGSKEQGLTLDATSSASEPDAPTEQETPAAEDNSDDK